VDIAQTHNLTATALVHAKHFAGVDFAVAIEGAVQSL
jgi:hypothetical protein